MNIDIVLMLLAIILFVIIFLTVSANREVSALERDVTTAEDDYLATVKNAKTMINGPRENPHSTPMVMEEFIIAAEKKRREALAGGEKAGQ